jgi:hypothetical protein
MLINVLGKLPYSPVLHCRTVALGASIALALVYVPALEPFKIAGWQALGSVFQSLADWALEQFQR